MKYLCILVNLFFCCFAGELTFFYPEKTPETSPNLSSSDSYGPGITCSKSGQYVYTIWNYTFEEPDSIKIQISRSTDFGNTWETPISITESDVYEKSAHQEIVSSHNGKYVYAILRLETSDDSSSNIQIIKSNDYGKTWDITLNTSSETSYAAEPNISVSADGQYVYAIYRWRENSSKSIVEIVRSSDYGNTWSNPILLSDMISDTSQGDDPIIAISETGRYIHAIWRFREVSGDGFVTQVSTSPDFGNTWSFRKTISDSAYQSLDLPTITTDQTGQYIYALWIAKDSNKIVQFSKSSDFGTTWSKPQNLSNTTLDSQEPRIIANPSGQYIYAIWSINDGSTDIIQISFSSDFGQSWSTPTYLSDTTQNADEPKVRVSEDGKNVHALWRRSNGEYYVIQSIFSQDFGKSWSNIYDLSTTTDEDNDTPYLEIDSTGKYVYVIWQLDSSLGIQTAFGNVLDISCYPHKVDLLLQQDYVNELKWNKIIQANSYKVYCNSLQNLIYEGKNLSFSHHGAFNPSYYYYLTWVNSDGTESFPVSIETP